MIVGDHDNIVVLGESATVMSGILGPSARSSGETSAVRIEHDGALLPVVDCRSPDVQELAVLRLGRYIGAWQRIRVTVLNRLAAILQCIAHTGPGGELRGRLEAIRTLGKAGIRHTLEDYVVLRKRAAELPSGGLHYHRFGIRGSHQCGSRNCGPRQS